MDTEVTVVVTIALFAWGLFSNRLERADLTAPIAFIAVGAALAGPTWSGSVRCREPDSAGRAHPGVGAVLRRGATPRPAAAA